MKDGKIYDIGERAVKEVLSLVQEAKFILWSGPMGNIEEGDFDKADENYRRGHSQIQSQDGNRGRRHGGGVKRNGNSGQIYFRFHRRRRNAEFLASGTLPGIGGDN